MIWTTLSKAPCHPDTKHPAMIGGVLQGMLMPLG